MMFVAQVLVPIGYMPASLSSGQYVQLCPTGLGPDIMKLLHPQHVDAGSNSLMAGDAHAHMGHHSDEQAHQAVDHHSVWSTHCPYGAFASNDIAPQALLLRTPFLVLYADRFVAETAPAASQNLWPTRQPRAPPAVPV